MKNYEFNMIEEYIKNKVLILENEFKEYFFKIFPNRNEKYFNYYLMGFYRNNLLYKFDNNKLKSTINRKKFEISLDLDIDLRIKLENIYPTTIISYYNISIFNNFISLQLQHNIHIIEVYSYMKETVLSILLNNNKYAVLEEDYDIIRKYANCGEIYIVKTINDDSPIIRRKGKINNTSSVITVPKIEKLLIDILVDDFYKNNMSSEITNIYYNVLKHYQINQTTLFRYARKRYCYDKLLLLFEYIGYDKERGEFK